MNSIEKYNKKIFESIKKMMRKEMNIGKPENFLSSGNHINTKTSHNKVIILKYELCQRDIIKNEYKLVSEN